MFRGGLTVQVLKIYRHETYRPNYINDIALLKTRLMLTSLVNARPIKLPKKYYEPPIGTMLNMTGFGLSEQNPYYYNERLKIANISVLQRNSCQTFYLFMTNGQFCAGGNRINSGYGDAGGPVAKERTLVGITLTQSDTTEQRPDLFTNVGHYVTWINKFIY